jgi:hypothetical protein
MAIRAQVDNAQTEASGGLGVMTYGDNQYQGWVLAEENVIDEVEQA